MSASNSHRSAIASRASQMSMLSLFGMVEMVIVDNCDGSRPHEQDLIFQSVYWNVQAPLSIIDRA